jgi:membrane protein YdbS with pleckstrin-like domain
VELEALDHVGLVVSDMSRSVRWYQEVLGLRRAYQEAWGEFPAVLEANGSGVALFPSDDGVPIPADDPMRHVGFRTSRRGLEAAKRELAARGIEFEEGDYAVAWSLYLRLARAGVPGPPGLAAGLLAVAGGLAAWWVPRARYRHWRYHVAPDALELRHGVVRRVHSAIPYFRVQHIDVAQGPVERAVGLARLVLHTASAGTDATIPGIAAGDAEGLRRLILARAGHGDAV